MSSPSTQPLPRNQEGYRAGIRTDSIITSIMLLGSLTVLQRGVGLLRNVLFCNMLADDQLGRWSLVFNFLLLAAPLAVLGLPGSFGRFVEAYRQRGELQLFVRRTATVSLGAALLFCGWLVLVPQVLARVVFDNPGAQQLVRWTSVTLLAVIVFNFVFELLTALRLTRYASMMQLISSLAFAGSGVVLLAFGWGEQGAIVAYGVASALGAFVGIYIIRQIWRELPTGEATDDQPGFWRRLVPFAAWVWVANLISNLFEVADQFMLKHCAPPSEVDALLGQYYSSRVIPLLLVSLAALLVSSLMPHFSRAWEAGARAEVHRQINLTVRIGSIFFTAAGALVLLGSPFLFDWAFAGRYGTGLAVLPCTLTYSAWYCATCLAMTYLWCAEKGRWGTLAMAVGLAVNLILNYLLAPRFGLPGVVAATAAANLVALTGVLLLSHVAGMRWDRKTVLLTLTPLALLLGGAAASAIVTVVVAVGIFENWIVDTRDWRWVRRPWKSEAL